MFPKTGADTPLLKVAGGMRSAPDMGEMALSMYRSFFFVLRTATAAAAVAAAAVAAVGGTTNSINSTNSTRHVVVSAFALVGVAFVFFFHADRR